MFPLHVSIADMLSWNVRLRIPVWAVVPRRMVPLNAVWILVGVRDRLQVTKSLLDVPRMEWVVPSLLLSLVEITSVVYLLPVPLKVVLLLT